MPDIQSWRILQEVSWEPITHLGQEWMVKSTAGDQGYAVMLTNGCGLWGEKRSAKYVLDKADDWASSIEAGITDLALLVLSEMKKKADIKWDDDNKVVKFSINSRLDDMSYSWVFQLNRLSDELFQHHWVVPLLVHFHHLGARIKQLTTELDNKNRQLEELLPDNKKPKNSTKISGKNKAVAVDSSAETVISLGASSFLQEHAALYPQIMKSLHKIRNADHNTDSPQKQPDATSKIKDSKRQIEGKTEEESDAEELEKQQERRAKIQEIMQGTAPRPSPQKKKKKLNL